MTAKEELLEDFTKATQDQTLMSLYLNKDLPKLLRDFCRDLIFRLELVENIKNYECIDLANDPKRQVIKDDYGTTHHIFLYDVNGFKLLDFWYGDGSGNFYDYEHIMEYHDIWYSNDGEAGIENLITPENYNDEVPDTLDDMMKQYYNFKRGGRE